MRRCIMCHKLITLPFRRFNGITCDVVCDKVLARRIDKIGNKMVRGTVLSYEELQIVYAVRYRRELRTQKYGHAQAS